MEAQFGSRDITPTYGIPTTQPTMDLDFEDPTVMTPRELLVLRAIAIVAASISLTSGLLVGYWFIRMKRSFRHHLIMFLICSDFWKASWQLIYPAVVFTQGKVDRGSPFCQVTGFFISMGIEASDFAVLVIAIHSALYIFRPGTALGEGGLYRYRYYLYSIWVAFPLLMASLAFLNASNTYTSQGTYCYLPARPIWLRLALAWIPRYIILVTILVLYASIYVYVRIRFRTFRLNMGPNFLELDDVDHNNLPTHSTPPRLPDLHSHGLLPPESPETAQGTSASDEPFVKVADMANGREKTHRFFGSPTAPPSTSGPIDDPTATAELLKRRYVIRRQLRLLFIYPLVYALMWVPPLIQHSLQYTDYFARHPSFPLQCIVSFTLPIQCAVDCWLFATREKPWIHIPHAGRKTFWFSFVFWRHDCGHEHDGARCPQAVEDEEELRQEVWRNTSRRSMSIEQRAAYARREAERREAEAKRRLARRSGGPSAELGGIPEEVEGAPIGKQRKGSVASTQTAATGGTVPRNTGGAKYWWDKADAEYLDEEEEDEMQRGRKHNSELDALEASHAMSSSDVTVRDDSSNSGKGYGSGVASGSGSRSVSASAATSTTKRDSGSSDSEDCPHNGGGSGWEGISPMEHKLS